MRYGKVYFYDRMGNREPTESDKIKEALNSFDAPRFRPPKNASLSKTYNSNFSPLETPPPFRTSDFGDVPKNEALPPRMDSGNSSDIAFPPRRTADVDLFPLSSTEKYGMSDTPGVRFDLPAVPDDPVPSALEPPRHYNPVIDTELAETIGPSIDEGIRRGVTSRALLEDDMAGLELGNSQDFGETSHKMSISHEELASDEICAQCRLEELHMNRLRAEADANEARHRAAEQRAIQYETSISKKEEEIKRKEETHRRQLMAHVDKINDDIMAENRRRRVKSPPTDYYIFRREGETTRESEKERKEAYGMELTKQIEEKRRKLIREHENEEELDAISNNRAAREFAEARAAELKQAAHEKERMRKGLEFQMEMEKRKKAGDDHWLWWAERPDEHGWREARMREGGRQLDRNIAMQNSIANFENFKRQQEDLDSQAREARNAKYGKIRERIQENSELIFGSSIAKRPERQIVIQPDPRVEAAWRAAHEQNDKKYRILQENVKQKSISGAALGGSAHSSCRRCVRCARPLQRNQTFTVSKGEFILPAK